MLPGREQEDCQRRGRISGTPRREEHWLCGIRRARTAAEPTPESQRGLRNSGVLRRSLGSRHFAFTGFTERACRAAPSDRLRDAGAPCCGRNRSRVCTERRLDDWHPHVGWDCRGGDRSRARTRRLHVCVCARLGLHDRRPAGVCELPRHERAIRRLDQEQPSLGRRVQRLSRAPQPGRQVCDERQQRLLALVLLHDGHFSRANPGVAGKPGDRGGELPPLPRAGRRRDGDARTRRIARHLVYPLSRVRGPYGTARDQRSPSRRGEPCPTRNQAECAGGAAVPS